MNKYELALVVNAKIEDDARTATVEKAKEYIARFGGTVTEVEDWGKKRLAYEVQKASIILSSSMQTQMFRHRWNRECVSWITFFVSYALEKTRHKQKRGNI